MSLSLINKLTGYNLQTKNYLFSSSFCDLYFCSNLTYFIRMKTSLILVASALAIFEDIFHFFFPEDTNLRSVHTFFFHLAVLTSRNSMIVMSLCIV